MTHAPIRNICATTAICAVLALGSTPAWAQEAATQLDAPLASAPASPSASAPQPTIALPAEAPAPQAPAATSQPVIQLAPATPPVAAMPDEPTRAAAPVDRRQASRAAAAQSRNGARAAASEPAPKPATQPQPSAPEPQPPEASVPLTQSAVAPPPALTAAPEGAQAASENDWLTSPTAGLIALLAALGLGAGAYAVTRAARRRREDGHEDVHMAEPAPTPVEPQPLAMAGGEPELKLPAYAMVDESEGAAEVQPVRAAEPTRHPTTAQRVGSEELAVAKPFVMPTGPVPTTREERDALLEEMVSAPPDADNPFTSRKGRLRRARIILQTREHQQKEEATKPFDWRTYKPLASNPAPATPPRVTV